MLSRTQSTPLNTPLIFKEKTHPEYRKTYLVDRNTQVALSHPSLPVISS